MKDFFKKLFTFDKYYDKNFGEIRKIASIYNISVPSTGETVKDNDTKERTIAKITQIRLSNMTKTTLIFVGFTLFFTIITLTINIISR